MQHLVATCVVAVLVLFAATGCIDQDENAATFCERNVERLTTDIDSQGIPAELAIDDIDRDFFGEDIEELENSFSKTMRYAEDATRDIRNRARDVDDAYLDVHATYTDDDSPQDELDERRAELQAALDDLREACAAHLPEGTLQ